MTVTSKLSKPQQRKLENWLCEGAKNVETWPEHWFNEGEPSFSYCYDCALVEKDRLNDANFSHDEIRIDGGWGSEGDGPAFCETCGRRMENSLTTEGCKMELDHYHREGFDVSSDQARYDMFEVISSMGWSGPYSERNKHVYDLFDEVCERIFNEVF